MTAPCCYYHDHMPPGGWTLDATRRLAGDFSLMLNDYLGVHPIPLFFTVDSEDPEGTIEGKLRSVRGHTYWGDSGDSELHVPSLVFELASSGDAPLPLAAVELMFPSFEFRDWFATGLLATPEVPEEEDTDEEFKRRNEPEPDLCAHCGREFLHGEDEGWMDYITFEELEPWDEAAVHVHIACLPAYQQT